MKNLDVRNPWDNKVFDTIKTESEKEIKAYLFYIVQYLFFRGKLVKITLAEFS